MRPWRSGSRSGMRPFSAASTSSTASGRSLGAFQPAWASRGQRLSQRLAGGVVLRERSRLDDHRAGAARQLLLTVGLAAARPRAFRAFTGFRIAGARFATLFLRVRTGLSSSPTGGAVSGEGTSGSCSNATGSVVLIASIGTPSFVCDAVSWLTGTEVYRAPPHIARSLLHVPGLGVAGPRHPGRTVLLGPPDAARLPGSGPRDYDMRRGAL